MSLSPPMFSSLSLQPCSLCRTISCPETSLPLCQCLVPDVLDLDLHPPCLSLSVFPSPPRVNDMFWFYLLCVCVVWWRGGCVAQICWQDLEVAQCPPRSSLIFTVYNGDGPYCKSTLLHSVRCGFILREGSLLCYCSCCFSQGFLRTEGVVMLYRLFSPLRQICDL